MQYDLPFSAAILSAASDALVSIFSFSGLVESDSVTVIVQYALIPFAAVAVIFALPAETAFTTPLLSTVATALSELSHVTDLSAAVCGNTVADN